MRCKNCDYALWGLSPGPCPECGVAFRPSEFEFVPNAVRFLCPHCSQQYFGTTDRGLLDPPAFDCVSCGRAITMDQMVLEPGEGVPEARTGAERNPWLERERIGSVRAWWRTWRLGTFNPGRLIQATPLDASPWRSFTFGLVMWLLGHSLALGLFAVVGLIGLSSRGASLASFYPLMFAAMFALVGWVVVAGVWALITHGVLRLIASPKAGLGRTYSSIAYSAGGLWLGVVPCLSAWSYPLGVAWWAVGASIMVVKGQGVGGWRGTIATLAPLGLVVAAMVGLAVWVGSLAITQSAAQSTFQPHAIAQAIWTRQRRGAAMDHAIYLLHPGPLQESAVTWLPTTSGFVEEPCPIGGTPSQTWLMLNGGERDREVARVTAATPAGGPAQRVGHVVFTYWGIDVLNPRIPALWLAIYSPHPDVVAATGHTGMYAVVRATGELIEIPAAQMTNELSIQNNLRSLDGLPPLPDPDSVTTLVGP